MHTGNTGPGSDRGKLTPRTDGHRSQSPSSISVLCFKKNGARERETERERDRARNGNREKWREREKRREKKRDRGTVKETEKRRDREQEIINYIILSLCEKHLVDL